VVILMKGRVVNLLQFLLEQKEYVTTHQLASVFNVNIRSIQQDLVELTEWIKAMRWDAALLRATGSKVMLQVMEDDKEAITQFIHEQNPMLKIYTPEERKYLILLELFNRDEPMIVKEMEIDFRVSESTILRDLKFAQTWLEQRGMTLIRRQNYGIQVIGNELNWRIAAFDLIQEYLLTVNRVSLQELYVQLQYSELELGYTRFAHFVALDWLLPEEDFISLERIIKLAFHNEKYQLTDDAIASLLIHVAIVIHRVHKGKYITWEQDQLHYIKELQSYNIATSFFRILSHSKNALHFPEEEISYIAMQLAGSRFIHPERFHHDSSQSNVITLTNNLVRMLEGLTQLELRNDAQFMSGLQAHLRPMIERLKLGIPIRNELLKDVQNKYPDIFTATKLAVLSVEEYLPSLVPEDEIGYITLHVGAVIERMKQVKKVRRKRVMLVCVNGVAISNLIQIQITREFPEIEIIGTKPAFEVQSLKASDVDLIISTIDMKHPTIPVIYIRPILNTPDFEKLRFNLKRRDSPSMYWEEIIDKIVIKARENGLVNTSGFRENIRDIIYQHIYTAAPDDKNGLKKDVRPMLQDLLNEHTIKIVNQCNDWKEAIIIAGEMLLEQELVERGYIDAMVQGINEHGPYVVIAPGIALVHARPEDGVKEVCMSLLICQGGVSFGNGEKDPVELVFAFGAVDNNQHLRALSQMMTLLNNEHAIQQLKTATTAEDALSVLLKSVQTT
jgi:mannitol operon transcriptional antiterminator